MKRYTQTKTVDMPGMEGKYGNCWQTALECILDVPQGTLPDQVDCERAGHSVHNALQAYLRKHHGLEFIQINEWQMRVPMRVRSGVWHLISGKTIRTPKSGCHHAVVGRSGQQVWDVHPSRAGLSEVTGFDFLVPATGEWKVTFGPNKQDCICPACGGIPDHGPPQPKEAESRDYTTDVDGAVVRLTGRPYAFGYIDKVEVIAAP